ncbi:glycerophosphodiester phosphodiesterase [Luteimicrobium subarcticum]|uniref:Glycerophosphoryl diester phosphodiesterase n=1 Tax=Luteimicrobium subarcticum TaxID=620910 RepID=A0A2M8WSC8_9MICO|nr:glycerophosphodiester phosphodiesterase [Luteimicrobium subarcticum]PJI93852.1 glycerophosphoryl diester phosphodiesterase [Luteimicrobium subarcticum]
MQVIGHRGASAVAPQNTLAAFGAACRAGADAVELDVRRTADGALVVLHDARVDATTDGSGRVRALSAAQVGALDAGASFSPAFAGERVPFLADVLALLAAHDVGLLCELKGGWSPREVADVVAVLDGAGMAGRTLLQSFRRRTVRAAREAAPEIPRGLLVEVWTPGVLRACERLAVTSCNPSLRILQRRPGLPGDLHAAGFTATPWTLDDPADWTLAVDAGADGIITNDPGRLRTWLSAR